MRNFLLQIIANAIGFWIASILIPGISIDTDIGNVLLIATVFGFINAFIKPIVVFFSLPLIVLTIGLFALVINTALLMLTDVLLDSVTIQSFWDALFGSIVISIVGGIVSWILQAR